jgi:hypothetical protein
MSWYISYRSGSAVITNIFKNKDLAICAARTLLDIGRGDEIEAGPIIEPLEDDILHADDLQRLITTNRRQRTDIHRGKAPQPRNGFNSRTATAGIQPGQGCLRDKHL